MAFRGKATCKILKDIRRQIAEANDIELVIKECTYQGDCSGTCPRCEAEVAYLERELEKRKALGKAVKITGLAAASFAAVACSLKPQQKPAEEDIPDMLEGDVMYTGSTESEFAKPNPDDEWLAGGKRLEPEDLQPADKPTAGKPAPKEENFTDVEMQIDGEGLEPDSLMMRTAGMMSRPEFPVEGEEPLEVFVVAETMPEFPGGNQALIKYLSENVHYPVVADESCMEMEGRAIVQFTVYRTGEIVDAEVVRSSGWELLDNEVLRVINSMPKWNPGKQRGKPVSVRYTVPVNFKLQD